MQRFLAGIFTAILPLLARQANAQVVQLPTFQFFGMSTTVSVPDRGGAYLGGASSSSIGGFERGLPGLGRTAAPIRNGAIGGRAQSSGVTISASIHDFEAMDQQLLGRGNAKAVPRARRFGQARTAPDIAGRSSVVELRRRQSAANVTDRMALENDAFHDFERAKALVAEGKPGVAKVYLQRAAKRASPQLKPQIETARRALFASTPSAQRPPNQSNGPLLSEK